jgi:prolipoprotein diacylglyceryltransferase
MGLWTYLIYVVAIICAVWVIVDVLTKQKSMQQNYKVIWIVAAIIFSIITAIVYYFVVKKK